LVAAHCPFSCAYLRSSILRGDPLRDEYGSCHRESYSVAYGQHQGPWGPDCGWFYFCDDFLGPIFEPALTALSFASMKSSQRTFSCLVVSEASSKSLLRILPRRFAGSSPHLRRTSQ